MDDLASTLPQSFKPKLLLKKYLAELGTDDPKKLAKEVPVFAIWNRIRDLLDKYNSVIMCVKAITGSGKSLCLPQFGWAAFDKAVNVTIAEPLIPVVLDIANKTEAIYPEFEIGNNLGYKTKPSKIMKVTDSGIDVVTTGVGFLLLSDMKFSDDENNTTEIFILDEVHLRNGNYVYSCLDTITYKILEGERVVVILTSANLERELLFGSFRKAFVANIKMKLAGDELANALSNPVDYYDVAPFEESFADIVELDQNLYRQESFIKDDVADMNESILSYIVKAKFDRNSSDYKWINGGKGHVLVFLDGAKSIKNLELSSQTP